MDTTWIQQLPSIPTQNRYAQFGEEVVLDFIFSKIGLTNKFLVDVGAGGLGCGMSNSKYFLECGWEGLRMDGNPDPNDIGVKKEFITAENIIELFEKYEVPESFDYLSIDIDGNDIWVLEKILENGYKPRLIMNEFNGCINEGVNLAIQYNPAQLWEQNDYYGGSFEAFKVLGAKFGYSLIHEIATTNMIFIRDELIGGHQDFGISYLQQQYHEHSPNRAWVVYK